ncbi:MAG: hypothetical protein Kow0063_05390 [Anaerolineae bacterium]
MEREWLIDDQGIAYVVDLALPVENGWLSVSFSDRPDPASGLRFAAEAETDACLREMQAKIRVS